MSRSLVVIGAGQGGLSAAVHAALAGWKVKVLERSDRPGGKAAGLEVEGFRLDPGPSIIIMPEVYQEVFRRAGRNPDDFLRFKRLDPFTRVILEGGEPLDLPADPEGCLDVLSRAAPQDAAGLRTILEKLDRIAPGIEKAVFGAPIEKVWQLADPRLMRVGMEFDVRKTYRELVDGFFKSDLMRAFFYGFPSYNGQTYDSKAAGALMIPYLMIRRGVWEVEGGVAAIPAAFAKLAEELGVEFEYGVDIVGREEDERRLTAVLDQAGRRHEADAFIANADRHSFGRLLGRPEPRKPSFSYFTLHWGIRKPLPQLSHHTLLIPTGWEPGFVELYRDRRPPTDPIIYLNSTPAPEGCSCLFAVVTVPGIEDHLDWKSEETRLREKVRESLNRFGIAWAPEEQVFERVQSPTYFQAAHRSWRGCLYGADESERLWGMLPLRPKDDRFRNLAYSGGTVQPGAGLPMVTLSGRFAVDSLG
ncbi:MAG: phytoene desaturase family protein [Fimbriimonadaceae bacterium]|nr:phytoene desaturase family protein [Fimbriimonadaceae bacterium]